MRNTGRAQPQWVAARLSCPSMITQTPLSQNVSVPPLSQSWRELWGGRDLTTWPQMAAPASRYNSSLRHSEQQDLQAEVFLQVEAEGTTVGGTFLAWNSRFYFDQINKNIRFNRSPSSLNSSHTQALHTDRINLSPFTKDFRVWGAPIETYLFLTSRPRVTS